MALANRVTRRASGVAGGLTPEDRAKLEEATRLSRADTVEPGGIIPAGEDRSSAGSVWHNPTAAAVTAPTSSTRAAHEALGLVWLGQDRQTPIAQDADWVANSDTTAATPNDVKAALAAKADKPDLTAAAHGMVHQVNAAGDALELGVPDVVEVVSALGWVREGLVVSKGGSTRIAISAGDFRRMARSGVEVGPNAAPAASPATFLVYDRNGRVLTGLGGEDLSGPQTDIEQSWGYDLNGTLTSITAHRGDTNDGVTYRIFLNPMDPAQMAVLLPQVVESTVTTALYIGDGRGFVRPADLSDWVYIGAAKLDEDAGSFSYVVDFSTRETQGASLPAPVSGSIWFANEAAIDMGRVEDGMIVGVGMGEGFKAWQVTTAQTTWAASGKEPLGDNRPMVFPSYEGTDGANGNTIPAGRFVMVGTYTNIGWFGLNHTDQPQVFATNSPDFTRLNGTAHTHTVLDYIDIAVSSAGTNIASAYAISILDMDGNAYPNSDWRVTSMWAQDSGVADGIAYTDAVLPTSLRLGRNKSGTIRLTYAGDNPNGTSAITLTPSNGAQAAGEVAHRFAGSNQATTFASPGDITTVTWTTEPEHAEPTVDRPSFVLAADQADLDTLDAENSITLTGDVFRIRPLTYEDDGQGRTSFWLIVNGDEFASFMLLDDGTANEQFPANGGYSLTKEGDEWVYRLPTSGPHTFHAYSGSGTVQVQPEPELTPYLLKPINPMSTYDLDVELPTPGSRTFIGLHTDGGKRVDADYTFRAPASAATAMQVLHTDGTIQGVAPGQTVTVTGREWTAHRSADNTIVRLVEQGGAAGGGGNIEYVTLIDVDARNNTLYPFSTGETWAEVKANYDRLLISGNASRSGIAQIRPWSLVVDLGPGANAVTQSGFQFDLHSYAGVSIAAAAPTDTGTGLRYFQSGGDAPTDGRMQFTVVAVRAATAGGAADGTTVTLIDGGVKYSDGTRSRMELAGRESNATEGEVVFPEAFAATPVVSGTPQRAGGLPIDCTILTVTTTGFTYKMARGSTDAPLGAVLMWTATGTPATP